jgi:hypothetical protein
MGTDTVKGITEDQATMITQLLMQLLERVDRLCQVGEQIVRMANEENNRGEPE